MNKERILSVVMVIVVLGVMVFGVTTCSKGFMKDRARVVEQAANDTEKYGVEIKPYQGRRCLNGWLIVNIEVHAWVYPRDELGELIPCEKHDTNSL